MDVIVASPCPRLRSALTEALGDLGILYCMLKPIDTAKLLAVVQSAERALGETQ